MIRPMAILACLSVSTLAACVPTPAPLPNPAKTGSNLTSVAASTCRSTIAAQTGRPISDVAVFDAAKAEAEVGFMATIICAEAPWACQSSLDGQVARVTCTGSEGSL